jgi:hypothetical protein
LFVYVFRFIFVCLMPIFPALLLPVPGLPDAPYSPTYAKTKQLSLVRDRLGIEIWIVIALIGREISGRRTLDAASTSSFLLFTTPTLYHLT